MKVCVCWIAGELKSTEETSAEILAAKESGVERTLRLLSSFSNRNSAAAQKLQLAYHLLIDSEKL